MTYFRRIIAVGAVGAFLAVALGAFGAHGLKNVLPADLLTVYQKGVTYHFGHSLALILTGITALVLGGGPFFRWSALAFGVGILLFSGSLYILAISGVRTWGAVTPLGGISFMTGWLLFALGALRAKFSD